MTPAARIQAAIELLSEIEATPRPADAVASLYFKNRRFIGSKDRQGVAGLVYSVLRHWARLHWWLDKAGHEKQDARALLIAETMLAGGRRSEATLALFEGVKFGPAPLSEAERKLIRALDSHTLDTPQQGEAVRGEVPDWAAAALRATLGDRFQAEMAAMLEEAPLDLRVNPLKGTREAVRRVLAEAGVEAQPTPLSPFGLRVKGRAPVATLQPFRDGLFEIQDEGSQLVALLADARPGMQVVDFCAGAGGKTLAIAAMMANKGRVVAADVLEKRLDRAKLRFRRAGLHNIETRGLSTARDPWVKRHKGKFDRVLVDAPCTGTGTWRRNPDSRWRPLGPGLAELLPLQVEILDSAARLVKPGGRLVYATCSMLRDENEAQVERFLVNRPGWRLVPVPEAWPEALGNPPVLDPMLRLTPARNDTDGFFAAVLERVADAAAAAETSADETSADEPPIDESPEETAP